MFSPNNNCFQFLASRIERVVATIIPLPKPFNSVMTDYAMFISLLLQLSPCV